MSGGGRAGGSKRKRNCHLEHSSFLEERPLRARRANLKTVEAAASISKAWLKCGEGFQDTSETLSLASENVTINEKSLELSLSSKKASVAEIAGESPSELADITWSSSGSDFSEEDETLPEPQRDGAHGHKTDSFCNQTLICPEDRATEDELQFIDWEINSDMEDPGGPSECEDDEGTVDISDCASCASGHSLTNEDRLCELPEPISTEILEYSSDNDKEDEPENSLVIDSGSPHKYQVDCKSDIRQSVNKQTVSAKSVLSTPQKYMANFPKTPEHSAAKKKLLRGGLAERLKELQNRERSAISLWRHRCVSYQMTPLGRKSGVLTVKILELHEECSMQVAVCEQLAGPSNTSPTRGVAPRLGAFLKVLFTRETADYLRGHPQDIIYIFPPWQKLLIPNGSCSIILNTYFCQKAIKKETVHEIYCQDTFLPRRSITLAQMFRIEDITSSSPRSQITTGTEKTHGHDKAEQYHEVGAPLKDSLLDIVEIQRAGPWSEVRVRVVVQRVYFLSRDGPRIQQGHSVGHADSPGAWSCLLVQDTCGMFGEVYLDGTLWRNMQLEGRSCNMVGMKVIQKATRGRIPGLFSLIDTMWPPVMPLAKASCGQPSEEIKTCLPPPTFCYIFYAHPSLGHISPIEGDPISDLYQPPAVHCLREILQTYEHGMRCSFYARVIYQRTQLKNILAQKEIWLLVTDITLQIQNEKDHYLPKTLPIYIAPSCVLSPEVLEGLTKAVPHNMLFRDALQDKGQIVCVERTVLLPQKSLLYAPSGADSCDLPGPVTLDELVSFTPVNSICSVQGAVVDVDESTFSWPVCDRCGNGRLEQKPEDGGPFFCVDCSQLVVSPPQKRQLHVFLDCPTRPKSTVKVKLLESSISSLLVSAASKDGSYEMKTVLGKEMGPLLCFVQSITPQQTSCVILEEIELLGAGGMDQPPC